MTPISKFGPTLQRLKRATSSHNLAVELSRRFGDTSLVAEFYSTKTAEPEGAWLPDTISQLNEPTLSAIFEEPLATDDVLTDEQSAIKTL